MKKALITVIVPIYNSEQYLSACVESIIHQTYSNLEIILVNDGSTDSSLQICQQYAEKDSRIIVLDKENGGQATARNMALDIAKGDYIGFVDSDDTIELDMYENLYNSLVKHQADIAVCGRYNVYSDGTRKELFVLTEEQVWDTEEAIRRFLMWDCLDGSPCDKLMNRTLLQDDRFPTGYICEDLPVVYRVVSEATRIVHIGTAKYNYFQREGSTSHSKYSQKTRGLIIYPKAICFKTIDERETLKNEAGFFYFTSVLSAANRYANSKIDDAAWLKNEVRKCLETTQGNEFVSINNRFLLRIYMHRKMYTFLRTIKRRLHHHNDNCACMDL